MPQWARLHYDAVSNRSRSKTMSENFVLKATRTGWELSVEGKSTAILTYDARDDALQLAMALARRRGVDVLVQEADGHFRPLSTEETLAA